MEAKTKNGKVGKLYKGIKVFVFFCVLFLMLGFAGKVLQRKESVKKYADFWELSEQIDVLFFGSSHMLNGINPLELFAEYGITSYNMAKHGGMVTESYWMLMNALDYCTPKCVVVDLWALDRDYQYIDLMDGNRTQDELDKSVSFFHDNIDSWPLTKTKMDTINDLISDYEIRKEFVWDFSVYHDRWSSVNAKDFKMAMGEKVEKSYLGSTPVYITEPGFSVFRIQKIEEELAKDTVCVEYLYKIIEECQKREIELILTFMPMAGCYEQDWLSVNTGERIAAEKNILFLNLLPHDSQNVVDYELDMFDEGHANNSGMKKLTSFVGKYLCEVEGIVDHREDSEYQQWKEMVSQWEAEENQRVLSESNLYLELSMLYNLDSSCIIFMPGGSAAIQDDTVQKLVMQLSGSDEVAGGAEQGGPYLMIRDGSSGTMQVQEFVGEQQVESFESILGDTCYIGLKNFGAIYVDGNLEDNYLNMEEHYETEVQIIILGQDGEVISKLYYDPVWNDMKRE